jgi:molecular chaperone DnaJ
VRYQQGFFSISRTCPHCHGTGEIISTPCQECRGTGKIRQRKNLKIRVPAGIDNGNRLRLEGEGEPGETESLRGDLYVAIRVAKHHFFEREGDDLLCDIPISFSQAALGSSLEIPSLDDNNIKLSIPPGIQSGEVLKLKARGIKDIQTHRRGDLYVRVLVKTPEKLTKEQKELLRRLAELRGENLDEVDRSFLEKWKNIIH